MTKLVGREIIIQIRDPEFVDLSVGSGGNEKIHLITASLLNLKFLGNFRACSLIKTNFIKLE
jgi:hypothetical protein